MGVRIFAAVATVQHHFHRGPHQFAVSGPRHFVDHFGEAQVAFADHLCRHLIGHLGRRSARSLGVLESEGTGELRRPHHIDRGLEVRIGLTGEADNDVGGDRRLGDCRAHPLDDAEVTRLPVAATHPPQHLVRA